MAVGGNPRGQQIGGLEVNIVEHVGDETVGHRGRWMSVRGDFIALFVESARHHGGDERSGRLFHGEPGDHLRLAFIEELKVVLLEGADGVSLAVAHDHGNQHQVHAAAEGNGRFAGTYLGSRGLRIAERGGEPDL